MREYNLNEQELRETDNFWEDKPHKAGEPDEIENWFENFVSTHNTCALATAFIEDEHCESDENIFENKLMIRNTPVEYSYHDGCFWIFSEGGHKFRGIVQNGNVCLTVYDDYSGFGKLRSAQIQGKAELVKPFSSEYTAAAEFRKIPITALQKLDHPMHLIKVVPAHIDILNSEFKESGLDARQKIDRH